MARIQKKEVKIVTIQTSHDPKLNSKKRGDLKINKKGKLMRFYKTQFVNICWAHLKRTTQCRQCKGRSTCPHNSNKRQCFICQNKTAGKSKSPRAKKKKKRNHVSDGASTAAQWQVPHTVPRPAANVTALAPIDMFPLRWQRTQTVQPIVPIPPLTVVYGPHANVPNNTLPFTFMISEPVLHPQLHWSP